MLPGHPSHLFAPHPIGPHPHQYPPQRIDQRQSQPVTQTPMLQGCHWASVDSQHHMQELYFPSAQQPIQQVLKNVQMLNNSSFSQHDYCQMQYSPPHAAAQDVQQHSNQPDPGPGFMFSLIKREQMAKAAKAKEMVEKLGSATVKDEMSQDNSQQQNSLRTLRRNSVSGLRSIISHGQEQQKLSASREQKPRPKQARIYVNNRIEPVPKVKWCPYLLPDRIVQQLPKVVVPANPLITQSVLKLMKPTIVYAEYETDVCDGCRSRGICVHFSFVLGGRHAPDGLICSMCYKAGIEKSVAAQRVCPEHNDPHMSQFTTNLSEDILAANAQRGKAVEILSRSWHCNWEGVSSKVKTEPDDGTEAWHQSPQLVQHSSRTGSNETIPSIEMDKLDADRPAKRLRMENENEGLENGESGDKENGVRRASEAVKDNVGLETSNANQLAPSDTVQPEGAIIDDNTVWWQDLNAAVDDNFLFAKHSLSLHSWSPEPPTTG
ncbi:hypothetical protein H2198_004638 [Neophaeococcomyces mojaviensis]|uniref:Uncharacterized protein n=1 Tax=Neophaeococcomyces mojaviensis TaxID=3383035 RepID=A0ACC3A7V9_9EURO|nr:hypothetical protein H2198_004638 [Knufia sp. JES_112]